MAGGCELATTACVDRKEEVQGTAACSFIPPPLLQDSRLCIQLMRSERDAPWKRDLALEKARRSAFTTP